MAQPSGNIKAATSGVNLTLLRALLILALGLWIYSPAFHGAWLGDDDLLVTANRVVHDPAGLWKIWFEPAENLIDYQPIKASVVWLQWHLWGDDTLGYHLTNVILHLISCLLIWRLLDKFGLRWAWLGGLIFVVHPVLVESVAWIAELKNTLSLPPLLLAMIFWIDFEEHRRSRDYFLAFALFVVAMLCKGTPVMFPVVLLLYAWWKRQKLVGKDLEFSIPFFAVSMIVGLVTIWFLHHHAIGKQDVVIGGPFSRLALAGLSMAFYFSKCVLPIGLIPIYPRWIVDPPSPIQFLPLPVLAAVIYWFWTRRRSWGRHALLGVGFFLVNLVPFVGFLTGSYMLYTWVMDHVLYIPIIGLIGLAVAGLEQTEAQLSRQARTCCAGFLALVMAVLAVESHGYAEIYINKEALFAYTVRHNLKALPAYLGLGDLYLERGRIAEALFHAGEAVRLAPDSEWAHCNLGAIYFKAGRIDEAMEQFNIAVKINPANASVQTNLASVLAKTGRFAAALEHFNQAIKLQPARSEALVGRGELKRCMGDWIGAVTDLDQALKLDPDSSQARLSRGVLRQAKGDPAGALTDLRHYREVAPKDPNADYAALWIWIIHADQGLKASADQELSAALNLNWNGRPGDLVSQHARFLLGQIDEEQYLADPAVADRKEDSGRVCETWYYAGIKRLLAGTKTPAAAAFRSCLATGKTDFFEYTLAQGELNALNSP